MGPVEVYIYILPLTAIAIAAFARPEISQPFEEISSLKVNDFTAIFDPVKAENVGNDIFQPVEAVNGAGQRSVDSAEVENTSGNEVQPVEDVNLFTASDTAVYDMVDEMPDFPGGQKALMDFVAKNIRYPEQMKNKGIQGNVVVSYVIAQDGSIRDIKVVRSLDPEGDAEAMRVVKAMPKWLPGKMKGKVVNTRYTLPINYRLQN